VRHGAPEKNLPTESIRSLDVGCCPHGLQQVGLTLVERALVGFVVTSSYLITIQDNSYRNCAPFRHKALHGHFVAFPKPTATAILGKLQPVMPAYDPADLTTLIRVVFITAGDVESARQILRSGKVTELTVRAFVVIPWLEWFQQTHAEHSRRSGHKWEPREDVVEIIRRRFHDPDRKPVMPEELVTGAVVYSGRTGEEMLKASDAASKAEYQRTPTTATEANSTYTDDMSAAGEGEYYQAFSIVHDGDVADDDPVVQGTNGWSRGKESAPQ